MAGPAVLWRGAPEGRPERQSPRCPGRPHRDGRSGATPPPSAPDLRPAGGVVRGAADAHWLEGPERAVQPRLLCSCAGGRPGPRPRGPRSPGTGGSRPHFTEEETGAHRVVEAAPTQGRRREGPCGRLSARSSRRPPRSRRRGRRAARGGRRCPRRPARARAASALGWPCGSSRAGPGRPRCPSPEGRRPGSTRSPRSSLRPARATQRVTGGEQATRGCSEAPAPQRGSHEQRWATRRPRAKPRLLREAGALVRVILQAWFMESAGTIPAQLRCPASSP